MKKNNRETGAKAEAIACWFLKQQGYEDPKECNDLFKEESSIF